MIYKLLHQSGRQCTPQQAPEYSFISVFIVSRGHPTVSFSPIHTRGSSTPCCAATIPSLPAAAAATGSREVQRKLHETEFSVTVASREVYLLDFSDESGGSEVIVMTESDDVLVETTVVVTGGSITTIMVGSGTYSVIYDDVRGKSSMSSWALLRLIAPTLSDLSGVFHGKQIFNNSSREGSTIMKLPCFTTRKGYFHGGYFTS